jgi:hypothetical protein
MIGTAYASRRPGEDVLDREVDAITDALRREGPADRRELARRVRARRWGPGRFSAALREAVAEGQVRRSGRTLYESAGRGERPRAETRSTAGS